LVAWRHPGRHAFRLDCYRPGALVKGELQIEFADQLVEYAQGRHVLFIQIHDAVHFAFEYSYHAITAQNSS
jgi:hypothetical protein